MDQYIMNIDGLNALVNQIGVELGGKFMVTDETPDALDQLQILIDDKKKGILLTKKHLASTNIVEKSLIPLLIYLGAERTDDDEYFTVEEKQEIFCKTMRLLMTITIPNNYSESNYWSNQPGCFEKQGELLSSTKEAFLSLKVCKSILSVAGKISEAILKGEILDESVFQSLNYTLLLIRNILFVPANETKNFEPTDHIVILRFLMKSGLTQLLINLLSSDQNAYWALGIMELISLMYRHEGIIKGVKKSKTASNHVEVASVCRVSTNSGLAHCENGTCSDTTMDTVDVSDVKLPPPPCDVESKKGTEASDDTLSESVTAAETITQDRVEDGLSATLRLHQLESFINARVLFWQYSEDLKHFTNEFLTKGFCRLVISLKCLFVSQNGSSLSNLYFMWIITHFFPLIRQTGIPFKFIQECMTVDVIGYLVYASVQSFENMLVARQRQQETKYALRTNHMTVLAIKEVLLMISHFKKDSRSTTSSEKMYLDKLQGCLLKFPDFRQLFLILIRHYDPDYANERYLADIISTNHQFLINSEDVMDKEPFDMLAHIKCFGSMRVMHVYGRLLEHFESNSSELNECIFTMMHHVAGDCHQYEVLLQFPIIMKFAELAQNKDLPQDTQDVVNFVIRKFSELAQKDPYRCTELLFGQTLMAESEQQEPLHETMDMSSSDSSDDWTEKEKDELFMLHVEYSSDTDCDVIDKIHSSLWQKGIEKEKQQIVVQLCLQGLVNPSDISCLPAASKINSSGKESSGNSSDDMYSDHRKQTIAECVKCITEKNKNHRLEWLKNILLELCWIKLGGRMLNNCQIPEEPVLLHYAVQCKSVPLITYLDEQQQFLNDPEVIHLLKLMGFHLKDDSCQIFHRIPHFWTPDDLLFKAQQLGQVDFEQERFTYKDVQANSKWWANKFVTQITNLNLDSDKGTESRSGDLWHVFVQQCNINAMA